MYYVYSCCVNQIQKTKYCQVAGIIRVKNNVGPGVSIDAVVVLRQCPSNFTPTALVREAVYNKESLQTTEEHEEIDEL